MSFCTYSVFKLLVIWQLVQLLILGVLDLFSTPSMLDSWLRLVRRVILWVTQQFHYWYRCGSMSTVDLAPLFPPIQDSLNITPTQLSCQRYARRVVILPPKWIVKAEIGTWRFWRTKITRPSSTRCRRWRKARCKRGAWRAQKLTFRDAALGKLMFMYALRSEYKTLHAGCLN